MQSFLYQELNTASRNKELKKIKYYGPVAAALGYLIQNANLNREDSLTGVNNLYRGMRRFEKSIDTEYIPQTNISLTGFTSTTKCKDTAFKFS